MKEISQKNKLYFSPAHILYIIVGILGGIGLVCIIIFLILHINKEIKLNTLYEQIVIVDFDYKPVPLLGGIRLKSITLSNPTKYAFRRIEYQFYDVNDRIVKIKGSVGPLMPFETKEFIVDRECEGLWEHEYGVRITGGEVVRD